MSINQINSIPLLSQNKENKEKKSPNIMLYSVLFNLIHSKHESRCGIFLLRQKIFTPETRIGISMECEAGNVKSLWVPVGHIENVWEEAGGESTFLCSWHSCYLKYCQNAFSQAALKPLVFLGQFLKNTIYYSNFQTLQLLLIYLCFSLMLSMYVNKMFPIQTAMYKIALCIESTSICFISFDITKFSLISM